MRRAAASAGASLLLAGLLLAVLYVSLGGDGEYWWATETAQIVMGAVAGCLVVGALFTAMAPAWLGWLRSRRQR